MVPALLAGSCHRRLLPTVRRVCVLLSTLPAATPVRVDGAQVRHG